MLILDSTRPTREHPMWAWPGETPNERYLRDETYRRAIDTWAKAWGKPGPHKFLLVRIIETKTSVGHTNDWWNRDRWGDCLFWVFQKPVYSSQSKYGYYVLEYCEAQRVIAQAMNRYGRSPFPNQDEMLILPIELCHQAARHETSGGVSDHLRPREEIKPTPEEEDREAAAQAYVEEKLPEVQDIHNHLKWKQSLDTPGE